MGLHFRRQHLIRGYIAGFHLHEAKLIVEIDGSMHNATRKNDRAREKILISNGLSLPRLAAGELERDPDGAIRTIEKKCRSGSR
jgi:cyclase